VNGDLPSEPHAERGNTLTSIVFSAFLEERLFEDRLQPFQRYHPHVGGAAVGERAIKDHHVARDLEPIGLDFKNADFLALNAKGGQGATLETPRYCKQTSRVTISSWNHQPGPLR
jgi:hypothetical protein